MNDLDINYRRSSRAKYLRITVDPMESITVTIPPFISLQHAKEFALSKQAWIQRHLQKIRKWKKIQPVYPELSQDELDQTQVKLLSRLDYFSRKYDLLYKKAVFRCQKTRWGSCSGQNAISLNINIAFLPEHLQDYILLHELCHIRYKNHSKHFWTQLDVYCSGRAKQLAKELKTHGMKIRR